jgi:hypothetical protein
MRNTAFIDAPDKSNANFKLFSKYVGKLDVVTAYVYKVDLEPGFRIATASLISTPDRAYFLLASGMSIPSHPGHHLLMTRFDCENPQYKFTPGRAFYFAYTESGDLLYYWPANLNVTPGEYEPSWFDDDAPATKTPPAFQLVYVKPIN